MLIPKEDVAEYKKLFKKVRHYKVMIFNGNDGSLDKSFHKFIRKNKYNEVFKVQNNGNKVSFYFLKWDNYIHEMVMKVAEEDSYILLGLKTKILESELHEIIASAEVELTAL